MSATFLRALVCGGTGDLNVQTARVLLMLGLTRSTDAREIAKIFRANQ